MTSSIVPGPISAGAWVAIQKGTGACDITSIPTGFKVLRLEILGNSTGTAITLKLNNDAGANYYWNMVDDGMSHSESDTSATIAVGLGGAYLYQATFDIVNIAAANKMITGISGQYIGGVTHNNTIPFSATWKNATNEINRITVSGSTPVFWVLLGCSL